MHYYILFLLDFLRPKMSVNDFLCKKHKNLPFLMVRGFITATIEGYIRGRILLDLF